MAGTKTSYQGGPFVDILTGHGKSPLDEFKITPPTAVQKVFDKNMKGFVFDFHGGSVAKMQFPKDDKQSLNLVQPFIVFQLMIPQGQPFSIEFGISDASKSKRRVHLSSAFNKPDSTPLHARIPLSFVQHGVWLNLCFDLISLVNNNFKGQSFRSLDLIVIHPSCTIRRIFTLRSPPFDTTDDGLDGGMEMQGAEPIPHTHEIPADVGSFTQIFTMEKLFFHLQQLQQFNQQQQQQSPPQPETAKTAVPLAFGRRVITAKGTTQQQQQQQQQPTSPPQPYYHPPPSSSSSYSPSSSQPPIPYPSSPQTPNTRLAAKAKAAAAKPASAAILTKPVTGRLPKVNSTGITKNNNNHNNNNTHTNNNGNGNGNDNYTVDNNRRGDKIQLLSPNSRTNSNNNYNNEGVDGSRPHRNITPVPPSPIFTREQFSEVPPRSASPEIPHNEEEDYGSSYYGSDDEFPVQNFDGVSLHPFANKEYQSSRYLSNDSTSAGSDRATSNVGLNPPYGFTSHINTKPVKRDEQIEFNEDWSSTVGNASHARISTTESQDIPLFQLEGTRKHSSITGESIHPAQENPTSSPSASSRPPSSTTRSPRPSTSNRPPTASSRPVTSSPSSSSSSSASRPATSSSPASSSRPPTSSSRTNTTPRPPTSSSRPPTTANRPPTSSARPPTGSARPPTSSRATSTSDKQRVKTPVINSNNSDNDKSLLRGQTAPSSGKTDTITNASQMKPNTAGGPNSARGTRERQSNMNNLAKTVEESELHRVRSSKTRLVDNTRQSGAKRDNMETVYGRLVAESTGLKKDLGSSPHHEEEDEDDMVNMGEDGDAEYDEGDEFGGDNDDVRDSIEVDREEEEEDLEREEGEEIDEEIEDVANFEEEEGEEGEEDEGNGYDEEVAEDLNNSMDKSDFVVESGGQARYHDSDGEGEDQLEFDSANNAYYDTKNKKFVHLH